MMNINLSQFAYQDLITHVLQYGSKDLKESHEAFGLLYGVRAGDRINIKKSVPTAHGAPCTNVFTETELVTFSEIDKRMKEEGLDCFGFYISHPDMGYYLSQNEIKNLLHFHNEKNQEYAFAIIADHAQMEYEGDFGVKAMKLKNPEKGTSSDFEKFDIEIEPPTDISLFRFSKYLIEQSQKHQPYVEEQGSQLEADDSIWDAFGGGDGDDDQALEDVKPILDELKKDIENVGDSFIQNTLVDISKMTNELKTFVKKPFDSPTNDLMLLRESLEKGIKNVQGWFDDIFNEHKEKINKEYARTHKMVQDMHDKNMDVIAKLVKKLGN